MSNFNYNRVMLGGRLTGDPEVKTTASGTNMVTWNLAVNRQSRNGQDQADFFRCIAYEKTALFVSQYFRKGQAMFCEGRIQFNNWTDDKGIKHFMTDVIVSNVQFVDSKAEASGYQQTAPEPTNYVPTAYKKDTADIPPNVVEIAENDELPF